MGEVRDLINELPEDTAIYLFEFLDDTSLYKASCVSKRWNGIFAKEMLWQNKCKSEGIDRSKEDLGSWKSLYIDFISRPLVGLVIKSHTCGQPMFTHLNSEKYGRRSLHIIVDSQEFSRELLEKHNPDILIVSNPAGATHQYSPKSLEAIREYSETHKKPRILGTFCVFYYKSGNKVYADHTTLAPLFGISDTSFHLTDCPTDIPYKTLSEPNSEFSRIVWSKFPDSKFTSLATYSHSHCPIGGWSEAGLLPGATLEATYGDKCAVISYRKGNLKSLYISTLIEYGVAKKNNAQWLYWALLYLTRK